MTKLISTLKAWLALCLLAAPVIGLLELSAQTAPWATGSDHGSGVPTCWSSEECTWLAP